MRRLRLAFETAADLAAEFERNISKGGAQIRTGEGAELREILEVELELRWQDSSIVFEAEVVHSAPGSIAVAFLRPVSEIRDELAPLFSDASGDKAPPDVFGDAGAGGESDLDSLSFADEDLRPPQPKPVPDPRGKTVLRVPRSRAKPKDKEKAKAKSKAAKPDGADPLEQVADRRKSPRATVRLPARVQAMHVNLEGRTRDLSESGVLISADGSDLPLGKRVKLELEHPQTGSRIEVSGEVSRHLETEGTVAAVGILFEPPPEQRRELRSFVNEVKRSEAERAASGITGRIEELGMASLLQMLGQSSPQGTLTASRGTEEATIAFENGQVRYALLGALRGVKALARVLQWSEGTFSFHAQVDALTDEGAPIPLQNALLEAARQVDEASHNAPLDARRRFQVNREAFAAAGELTKTEEAVLDLAGAGLSVRRMIDVIPDTDAVVHTAIRSLLERGLLSPRS